MEKFWESIQIMPEPDLELELIHKLFDTPAKTLGEIREIYDSYTSEQLMNLAYDFHYYTPADDGATEESDFGVPNEYTHCSLQETVTLRTLPKTIWNYGAKKKNFF